MQRFFHHSRTALLAAAWLLASATPVLAEDIEIYLGGATVAATTPCGGDDGNPNTPEEYVNCSYPNVLFLLDDSGSMSGDVNGNTPSGGNLSRMDNLKIALTDILTNVTKINAGLVNFAVPGGPILFPIADIDAPLSAVEPTINTYDTRVSLGSDDAEERLHNNSVVLNNGALRLVTDPGLAGTTVTSRPTVNADDMYERRTNSVNQTLDSSWLHMGSLRMDDNTRQPNASGVRFPNLTIPQGAAITAASLRLVTNSDAQTETVGSTKIRGQAIGNAPQFTAGVPAGGTAGNITARNRTDASATVTVTNITPWQSDGNVVTFSDPAPGTVTANALAAVGLTAIVQEIVALPGWASGNALALLFGGIDRSNPAAPANSLTGLGRFGAYTVNSSTNTTQDPLLTVTYTTGITNTAQDIGLRFTNVSIPQGSTITNAYIEMVPVANATDAATWTILGENVDDAATFVATASNIHDRVVNTPTAATVSWTPGNWTANTAVQTPSLTSVVQEIVNRSGWCGNNDMAFMLTGTTGERQVYSYDGDSDLAPRLVVNYIRSGGCGGGVTVRSRLIQLANALTPSGNTPIRGYYTEAARYFKGEAVKWGLNRGTSGQSGNRVSHPASYTGASSVTPANCADVTSTTCATETISGNPVYRTPILDECQNNYIVLLTDGEPTSSHADDVTTIQGWKGSTSCVTGAVSHELCVRELADYLHTQDQNSTFGNDPTTPVDDQTITTFTIGFGADVASGAPSTFLRDIASKGGGSFYAALDADDLIDVFTNILASIVSTEGSFESPALSVNSYNRLTNNDDLYFALFKPTTAQRWDGNVKKYKLGEDAVGNALILDANDAAAISTTDGTFLDSSRSYWSPGADGAAVANGGAASKLPKDRNTYTYTGDLGSPPSTLPLPLTATTQYRLNESNTSNVTTALLGVGGTNGDVDHVNLLKWASGEDPSTSAALLQFGDPLHSRPVVLSYFDDGTPANLDQALLTTNNRGYFSIINPNDVSGIELFSWVPKELLPNLNKFYNNLGTVTGSSGKVYGLDGEIALRITDLDSDGDLRDSGDKVYATFGMRRGGRNYYAIDLNRTAANVYAPKLQWEILGGSGDFAELGQTWSTPKLAKVKFNSVDKEVFFFGGGYDPNQDNVTVRTPDTQGRAIYMIDAQTGALLWMAGNDSVNGARLPNLTLSAMDYSIPSDVAILDVNGDGYTDRLYVGDMGGQIFRIDFKTYTNTGASNFAAGGRIAELADDSTTGNRRFYYEPDVALIDADPFSYLSLAIGSGYREHPLNTTIVDRFYALRDKHILDVVETANINAEYNITEASLTDLTADPTVTPAIDDGWYITMELPGEKVLASALTFAGFILFNSFNPNPDVAAPNQCSSSVGKGRNYIVKAHDASAAFNLDPTGTGKLDRVTTLKHDGIPPDPVIVFRDTGNPDDVAEPTLLVGSEVLDPGERLDPDGNPIPGTTGFGEPTLLKTWWRQTAQPE